MKIISHICIGIGSLGAIPLYARAFLLLPGNSNLIGVNLLLALTLSFCYIIDNSFKPKSVR